MEFIFYFTRYVYLYHIVSFFLLFSSFLSIYLISNHIETNFRWRFFFFSLFIIRILIAPFYHVLSLVGCHPIRISLKQGSVWSSTYRTRLSDVWPRPFLITDPRLYSQLQIAKFYLIVMRKAYNGTGLFDKAWRSAN